MILRDIGQIVNGRLDSSDPRVGVLASEIPTGFARPAFLLNDVDPAFPDRLYRLQILTLPEEGTLTLDKTGAGTFSGAPQGTYTGLQRVEKFDVNKGRVSSVEGTYTLQIVAAAPTVTGVLVSPSLASGSQQFAATVLGTNNPSQIVNWSATGGSIDAGGHFTAPAATYSVQTITITATSAQDPTKSGSATVMIAALPAAPLPSVTAIIVSPDDAVIVGGDVYQFFAEVLGNNGPSQAVTWATTLGEINEFGELTAPLATLKAQKGTVTATSVTDASKSASVEFSVPAQIVLDPENPQVTLGSRYARPVRDIARSGWVSSNGGDLHSVLDDTDLTGPYIATASDASCELGLRPLQVDGASGRQSVNYMAYSPTGGGITVELRQGSILIAAWHHEALPTVPTVHRQALTLEQSASISDYSNLRIKLVVA